MTINVIQGPAALAYKGRNGRTYWYGVASGNRYCDKLRCSSERAIADARKGEKNKGYSSAKLVNR